MFLVICLCPLFLRFCPVVSANVSAAVTKPNKCLKEGNSSDSFDRIPVLDNPGATLPATTG